MWEDGPAGAGPADCAACWVVSVYETRGSPEENSLAIDHSVLEPAPLQELPVGVWGTHTEITCSL